MWVEKNQKRYVLSARLKVSTVRELRMDRGRLFHSSEPKRLNDRSPMVLWVSGVNSIFQFLGQFVTRCIYYFSKKVLIILRESTKHAISLQIVGTGWVSFLCNVIISNLNYTKAIKHLFYCYALLIITNIQNHCVELDQWISRSSKNLPNFEATRPILLHKL